MPTAEPALVQVVKPGWCTTVQDLGRHGCQQYGISVSGAMDRVALVTANRLVGNHDAVAALEITLIGPELLFENAAVVAVTGADLAPAIDGRPVPLWETVKFPAGSRLTFGPRRSGARCYLAAAGGFDVPLLWGSRATHLPTGIGGGNGRALVAGEILCLHVGTDQGHRPRIGSTLAPNSRPTYVETPALRVIAGPQEANADALAILTTAHYQLTNQSNRMGYRLEGPRIETMSAQPAISDGTAMGALQIPPDGQPILLMADRPTTGGYPKIAVVITADLSQAAQLQPGDTVRFRSTNLQEAEAAFAEQWRRINEVLPPREA
jgi:antagonist of KipI